eukprot:754881-Hanusia_phi.AAC.1
MEQFHFDPHIFSHRFSPHSLGFINPPPRVHASFCLLTSSSLLAPPILLSLPLYFTAAVSKFRPLLQLRSSFSSSVHHGHGTASPPHSSHARQLLPRRRARVEDKPERQGKRTQEGRGSGGNRSGTRRNRTKTKSSSGSGSGSRSSELDLEDSKHRPRTL